jgi:hypothetical protein
MSAESRRRAGPLRCRLNRGRRAGSGDVRRIEGGATAIRCRPSLRAERRSTRCRPNRGGRAGLTMSAESRATKEANTTREAYMTSAESRAATASHSDVGRIEGGDGVPRCRPNRGRHGGSHDVGRIKDREGVSPDVGRIERGEGRVSRCQRYRGRGARDLGLIWPTSRSRARPRDALAEIVVVVMANPTAGARQGSRSAMRRDGSCRPCRPSVRFLARPSRRGACPSVIDDRASAAETPRRECRDRLRRAAWLRRFCVVMPSGATDVRCRPLRETGAR